MEIRHQAGNWSERADVLNPLFNPPRNFTVDHIYQFPVEPFNLFIMSWEVPESSQRELSGYNIYRNFEILATVEPEVLTFEDGDPPLMEDGFVYYFVTALYEDPDGESVHSDIYSDGLMTSANDTDMNFITELKGNYPNPFNPETTIAFSIADNDTFVKMNIYNLKGQLVKNLLAETFEAGKHEIKWDGKDNNDRNCGSGIYYYRLETKDYEKIAKMILLK